MEHKQFIEELQSRLGKDKKEIDNLFSDMLQIIKDRCSQMDTLSVQGFGAFEPRKKMERVSVNPATGKRMLIPPKIVLSFKPATVIKNRLKDIPGNE
ncbi:HU family DNA-binding protein [Coprobacter sp.]